MYWLILMLFTPEGKFIDKVEVQTISMEECQLVGALYSGDLVNSGTKTQIWCVTEDHYNGVKQDEGIPYDFNEDYED